MMPRGYTIACVDRDPALFLVLFFGDRPIADAACVPSLDPMDAWVYSHTCVRRAGWALVHAAHVHARSLPPGEPVDALPRRGEG
jgi:hypothetical protein